MNICSESCICKLIYEKDGTELITELRQSGWFAIIKLRIEDLQLLLQCVETDDDQTVEVDSMVLDNWIAYSNVWQGRVQKSLLSMMSYMKWHYKRNRQNRKRSRFKKDTIM